MPSDFERLSNRWVDKAVQHTGRHDHVKAAVGARGQELPNPGAHHAEPGF